MYLIGVKVDYKTDIMGSKFEFTNDNIQSKCGCGTSFAFKKITQ
jgi:Fe-S cluster assembly iron-binding protein IscA